MGISLEIFGEMFVSGEWKGFVFIKPFSQPCLNLVQTSLESALMHGQRNCVMVHNYNQNWTGLNATSVLVLFKFDLITCFPLSPKTTFLCIFHSVQPTKPRAGFLTTSLSEGGINFHAPIHLNILDFQWLIMLSMIIHMLSCWQATLPIQTVEYESK